MPTPLGVAVREGLLVGRQAVVQEGAAAPGFQAWWTEGTPAAADATAQTSLLADLRLDNRADLGVRLHLAPPELAACSDAALLLHGYHRWGPDVVEHLEGDFAFVLWDARHRRLVCARDAMGARTLFYHEGTCEGRPLWAYATALPPLRALPYVDRRVNAEQVAALLVRQNLVGRDPEATLYAALKELPPATLHVASPHATTRRRYWRLEEAARSSLRLPTRRDYHDAFRAVFEEAVRCRLRGGGVGAHLSGGLDSSTVACVAATLLRPAGRTLHAFGAVTPDDFDGPMTLGRSRRERLFMEAAAQAHPTLRLHTVEGREVAFFDGLEACFALAASFPLNLWNRTYLDAINRRARAEGLAALLTGAQGNLTLSWGGPPSPLLRNRLRRWWTHRVEAPRRGRELAAVAAPLARAVDVGARLRRHGMTRMDLLRRAQHLGSQSRQLFAAREGVELLDPTMDRRVVTCCLQLPDAVYRADGERRLLARQAFADVVPACIRARADRDLQSADWFVRTQALRGEMDRRLKGLAHRAEIAPYVDVGALERLLAAPAGAPTDTLQQYAVYNYKLLGGVVVALLLDYLLQRGWITL